jgi:hypothetical protein
MLGLVGAFILCANKAFGHDRKHRNHIELLRTMFRRCALPAAVARAASLDRPQLVVAVLDVSSRYADLPGDIDCMQRCVGSRTKGIERADPEANAGEKAHREAPKQGETGAILQDRAVLRSAARPSPSWLRGPDAADILARSTTRRVSG